MFKLNFNVINRSNVFEMESTTLGSLVQQMTKGSIPQKLRYFLRHCAVGDCLPF